MLDLGEGGGEEGGEERGVGASERASGAVGRVRKLSRRTYLGLGGGAQKS